jgi:hypothetical protein
LEWDRKPGSDGWAFVLPQRWPPQCCPRSRSERFRAKGFAQKDPCVGRVSRCLLVDIRLPVMGFPDEGVPAPVQVPGSKSEVRAPEPSRGGAASELDLGAIQVSVQGEWAAEDFASVLMQLDQAYAAAGALVWMAEEPSRAASLLGSDPNGHDWADSAIRAALTYYLGGGLQLVSINYGSVGAIIAAGAHIVLAPVAKFIGDWRETDRRREEQHLLDARSKERLRLQRLAEEHDYKIKRARLQKEAAIELLDRMPEELRGQRARELFDRLIGSADKLALQPGIIDVKLVKLLEKPA